MASATLSATPLTFDRARVRAGSADVEQQVVHAGFRSDYALTLASQAGQIISSGVTKVSYDEVWDASQVTDLDPANTALSSSSAAAARSAGTATAAGLRPGRQRGGAVPGMIQ